MRVCCWHATVTALGEAEIYVVPRRLLRELAAVFADVGPALDRFYRERLLANLIHASPLFARLAVDQRAGLLTAFEPMRVESGQHLVRQGEPAGGGAVRSSGCAGMEDGFSEAAAERTGGVKTCRLRAASNTSAHCPQRTQPSEILS